MRAPEFWSGDAEGRDRAPALQALLAPVSMIYAAAGAMRQRNAKPFRAPIPVICVGNLTLGGAGKTPVTRALRAVLPRDTHVLSRGYGGRNAGPLRVTAGMSADEVGDEPLLHAADGPAWISRDRVAGARAIAEAGARLIVMDDGHQNPTLAKDFSLVVIDASALIGNRRVFPSGPLREPLNAGLERADAIVLLRGGADEGERPEFLSAFTRPILTAVLTPLAPPPAGELVAFAGIARPDKFFDTLRGAGARLAECVPYADHHRFDDDELNWLATLARERGAELITTEKDHVRLPEAWRARVAALPVTARFDDSTALEALMARFAS